MEWLTVLGACLVGGVVLRRIYFDPRQVARTVRERWSAQGRLPTEVLARLSPKRRARVCHELIRMEVFDDAYGRAEEGVALLAEVDEPRALDWQIQFARRKRDHHGLVGLCERALSFHVGHVEFRVQWIESLLALGRVEEALEAAAWAEENRDPDLLRAYGDALSAAGASESAHLAYEEAERVEAERERALRALDHGIGA